MKIHSLLTVILVSLVLQVSCSNDHGAAVDPEVIKVSVLPDQSQAATYARFQVLLEYLGKETGKRFELIIAKDYQDLLRLFNDKKVHMARFGGFTFIKANQSSGAVPIVMRDIDAKFSSYFITKADDTEQSLLNYKGKRLVFGSRLSTSGHLMPRYFMRYEGVSPEKFFAKVAYSGAHDKTIFQVRDGEYELGAVNAIVFEQMINTNQIKRGELRVLWKTPPYPDYVWSLQAGLPKELSIVITDAFLKLSRDDMHAKIILDKVAADNYLPASVDDFKELRVISHELGLLEGD